MDIHLQRKIDRYAGSLICFLFSVFHRLGAIFLRPRRSVDHRRILVILLSEIGSLVLAQPMFTTIRSKYPNAAIYLLQFKKNSELGRLMELVEPYRVLTIDDSSLFRFSYDLLKAIAKLRMESIDVAIDCELFARISSIISLLSGAAVRVGFHPHTQEGLYRGGFINRPVIYNPYRHMSCQFITLVDAIDSTTHPKAKLAGLQHTLQVTPVKIEGQEITLMKKRLESRFGQFGNSVPEILIYPGGGKLPIRAWPPSYYQELCERFIEDGYTPGIIGVSQDKRLAGCIIDRLPDRKCLDLTGFTRTIRELLVLFHLSRLLITNDGGPGQFAALTPIMTIIFFGPETPILYGPMDKNARSLYCQVPCSPCLTAYNHRSSACDGDNVCLKSIKVEYVYNQATSMLNSNHNPFTMSE